LSTEVSLDRLFLRLEQLEGCLVSRGLAWAETDPQFGLRIGLAYPANERKACSPNAACDPIILRRLDVRVNIELGLGMF
jgi:hypothetical protein